MRKTGRIIAGVLLLIVGPLIVLSGTVYTLMLPNLYASSARIVIHPTPDDPLLLAAQHSADMGTMMQMVLAKPICNEVVLRLNLQKEWGTNEESIPLVVAEKILSNSLRVYQQRGTSLLVIEAIRMNPDEAAAVANEVALVFKNSRQDAMLRKQSQGIQLLKDAMAEQLAQIEKLQEKVEGSSAKDSGATLSIEAEILDNERFVYTQLKNKYQEAVVKMKIPDNLIEVIDVAEPNRRPVSPNLFLNVIVLMGIASLVGVVGLVLLISGVRAKS